MQAYAYMNQVSAEMDSINDAEQIHKIIDELEFLYETIDPEFQELCSDLINRLTSKLKPLG